MCRPAPGPKPGRPRPCRSGNRCNDRRPSFPGRLPLRCGWPRTGTRHRSSCVLLVSCFLDRVHVVVRQAEMMTDLMHQDMRDDMPKRLFVLGPIVQDRTPIEPDHVWHALRIAYRLKWQADALEQAKQVEFRFAFH